MVYALDAASCADQENKGTSTLYVPGWWEDISGARTFDELPAKARDYVLRLEELAGAQVSCIGVGPGREQTIVRHDVLGRLLRPNVEEDRGDHQQH